MKILVTGGLGLIGHNVVEKLEQLGHTVLIIDNKTNYGFIRPAELDYLLEERRKKIKKLWFSVPIKHFYKIRFSNI